MAEEKDLQDLVSGSTGMIIDGVAGSENIDSSGEILDVEGCDISDLEEGKAVLNWEHRGEEANGHSANDIVGKVIYACKIFTSSDCKTERQKKYWKSVGQVPYVYIMGRLFDGAGHPGAVSLAAMIRDTAVNDEFVIARYSIEGATLEQKGNRLERTTARRVAVTIKPCNRACDNGLVMDPNAPDSFKGKVPVEVEKDLLAEFNKMNKSESLHPHPNFTKLGAATPVLGSPVVTPSDLGKVVEEVPLPLLKALLKKKLLEKALAAGSYNAAPGSLTQGAALQVEDPSRNKQHLINCAKAAIRDYSEASDGDFRKFLKARMPEVDEEFVDHFADLVDEYGVKKVRQLSKQEPVNASGLLFPDPPSEKGAAQPSAPKVTPRGTVRGKKVPPPTKATVTKGPKFDARRGILYTDRGKFHAYNPDTDESAPAQQDILGETMTGREAFHQVWNSDRVRDIHDSATRNWLRLHHALKDGTLPEAMAHFAVIFSQLSVNTPVPIHELKFAHLVDTLEDLSLDPRKEGSLDFQAWLDWTGRDRPDELPKHSRDYFEDRINNEIRVKRHTATGRKPGDYSPFGFGAGHGKGHMWDRLAKYHALHGNFVDLVNKHRTDARSAVTDLMRNKIDRSGFAVPGLKIKTGRFAYSMLGAGNSIVPDTHFIRKFFGMDKKLDSATITHLKRVLWEPSKKTEGILPGMDQWFFENHPSVKLMLEHPEFGEHFKDDPEQAIFPAFWGTWLTIGAHEKLRGLHDAGLNFNSKAEHIPYFDAYDKILADPKERKIPLIRKAEAGQRSVSPDAAAHIVRLWEEEFGHVGASILFAQHMIPRLWHDGDVRSSAEKMRKAEQRFVEVQLRKAAEDTPGDPEADVEQKKSAAMVNFRGQQVQQPGLALFDTPFNHNGKVHNNLAILHADQHHLIGVPKDHLDNPDEHGPVSTDNMVILDRRDENRAFRLWSMPSISQTPRIIDAKIHSSPRFAPMQEQFDLIHGLDMNTSAKIPKHAKTSTLLGSVSSWHRNPRGGIVLSKPDIDEDGYSQGYASNEALYHNMAHQLFGLGEFVPTATAGYDPEFGDLRSFHRIEEGSRHYWDDPHTAYDVLSELKESGELDKIQAMDYVMSNSDRHVGNFLIDPKRRTVHLIDHGLLDLGWSGGRGMGTELSAVHPDDMALGDEWVLHRDFTHPRALGWAVSLDPEEFQSHLEEFGVKAGEVKRTLGRLQALRDHASSSIQLAKRRGGQDE